METKKNCDIKLTSYLILGMPGKKSPSQSSESPLHLPTLVAGQVSGAPI
jgi:hypothetical protein